MPRKKPEGKSPSMADGAKAKKAKAPAKAPRKPEQGKKAKAGNAAPKKKPAPSVLLKTSEGLEAPSASEPNAKGRGRPTAYRADLADSILERMHNGETLNEICKADDMPSERTVRRWNMDNVDGFSPKYKEARAAIVDYWADEIVTIGDNATNDWMERKDGEGNSIGWQANGDHISRSRLRVETRKWLLSKLRPEQYGDRTTVNHGLTNELAALLGQIDGNGFSLR